MTRPERALAGVVLALALALGVTWWQLHRTRGALRDSGLATLNARAAADSSRRVALSARDSARILGDSLAAVERLARQVKPQLDALDKALGRTTAAVTRLTAQVATLQASVASTGGTQEDTAGVRQGTFRLRQEPFTLVARAELPRPPAPGTLHVDSLALDPAPLQVRIQRGPPDPTAAGLRPVTALVVGPAWLQVRVDSVQVDPDLFNTKAGPSWWTWTWRLAAAGALGAGIGAAAAH